MVMRSLLGPAVAVEGGDIKTALADQSINCDAVQLKAIITVDATPLLLDLALTMTAVTMGSSSCLRVPALQGSTMTALDLLTRQCAALDISTALRLDLQLNVPGSTLGMASN